MKLEILRKGNIFEVLIDDVDWNLVKNYKWYIEKSYNIYYVRGYLKNVPVKSQKYILMHRLILGLNSWSIGDPVVDHWNGNGLDNRRENLREMSYSGNNLKAIRGKSKNKLGYTGISERRYKGKLYGYRVRIGMGKTGKRKHIGDFTIKKYGEEGALEKAKLEYQKALGKRLREENIMREL